MVVLICNITCKILVSTVLFVPAATAATAATCLAYGIRYKEGNCAVVVAISVVVGARLGSNGGGGGGGNSNSNWQ